jgi:Zn-dependent M28 family amino/carboxypeptidase
MKQFICKTFAISIVATGLFLLAGCHGHKDNKQEVAATVNYAAAVTPEFSADSAYRYVKEQLDCGLRSPNSKGHTLCREYLAKQMQRFCDTVYLQDFNTTLWNGTQTRGTNIIASINPESQNRIVLAAHWDSRLWADHDPDSTKHKTPLMGANDGASGVGMLMEMARIMKSMPPSIGIDFVFFDMEDQGVPEWADSYEDNTWCLGAQYWAKNKHVPFYTATYGILFDMVGTDQPRFTKEGFSRQYAPGITDKLWRTAAALGYSNVFIDMDTDPILDDHMFVNQQGGVPMVDFVQNSLGTSFFKYWHTTGDNLDCINQNTLKLVATVVMKTIYGDYPAATKQSK